MSNEATMKLLAEFDKESAKYNFEIGEAIAAAVGFQYGYKKAMEEIRASLSPFACPSQDEQGA